LRCLDTTTLVRFLAGSLAPQARAAIETHLAACDLCAQVACCGAARTARAPRTRLCPGARLGRYRLLEQLGRGGSAGVFAAFDVDLERRVALKVTALAPGRARELRARAVREGRALARVCHPNVVTVHEIGASGPYVYLVLELVAGLDVRAWRCAAPRAWSEVRDVFMDVGRGLAAVHDAGLVHGDVKAANVIVAGDGSPAKLLDLGLVTAASEPAGVLAGTPGYLAPERLRGAPADALTDQFAYCATLWEALFGALPPATAHGGAPAAEVPAALRAIALRGLARDRDARFADLGELVAALTSVGDARSTPRPPPAPRARAATARRRPPRRGTRPGA
jgi:serine/threonine protein kinase